MQRTLVAQLGDVNWLKHGGYFVYVTDDGIVAEKANPPYGKRDYLERILPRDRANEPCG